MEITLLLWKSFLLAFSVLLPLINPLGTSLVFLGLVGEAPPATYRTLARRIAINNLIFLAIIELLGSTILNFFGISLPIVQLSGGIVIAAIGWSTLNQSDARSNAQKLQEASQARIDQPDYSAQAYEARLFYPFTFPITSGPGTLVAILTLAARSSTSDLSTKVIEHIGIYLAVILLSAGVYLCYANAPRITKVVAPSTAHGILRVIAFILVCIGVQIAWNGLSELLTKVLHH